MDRKREASRTDALRVIAYVRSRPKSVPASVVAGETGLHTHVVHDVLTEAGHHGYVRRTAKKRGKWKRGRASDATVNDAYRAEIIQALENRIAQASRRAYLNKLMKIPPVQVADKQLRHRTGNDDHLELGVQKRPARKRNAVRLSSQVSDLRFHHPVHRGG